MTSPAPERCNEPGCETCAAAFDQHMRDSVDRELDALENTVARLAADGAEMDRRLGVAQQEVNALRAKLEIARRALEALTIDANRVLDVYPRDARGTYYDDLRRSVAVARAALEQISNAAKTEE